MSFKTLRKRIALVAVAALAVTGLSTVPANATAQELATAGVASINLAQATGNTNTTSSTVRVSLGANFEATDGDALTDGDNHKATFKAVLSSYPSGGYVNVGSAETLTSWTAATFSQQSGTAADRIVPSGSSITLNWAVDAAAPAVGEPDVSDETITASATTGLGLFTFVPTKVGTYVLTVWHDSANANVIDLGEAQQAITIVVTAAADVSTSVSQMFSQLGANTDAANSTDNLIPLVMSKTLATATRANVTVNLFDSNGTAMASGNTLTATITGVGSLSNSLAITADVPTATDCDATSNPRVKTGSADAVNNFSICSDGTAGTGTLTIEVTNAAGVTRTLGTKTLVFYGDAAKLTVSSQPINVLVAGGATSGVKTGVTGATLAASPAFVVKVTDANNNPVSGLSASLSGVSGNSAQVSAVSNNEGTVANDANGVYGGAGHYLFDATSPTTAASSATPTVVTIRMIDPAGDGTTYLTTTVSFTVGGSATKIELSTDKASYAPGDQGTLTLKATDSAGNPVSDRARDLLGSTGLTASKGVQGSLPTAASVETKKGIKTYTFFAPVSGGNFTISGAAGTGAAAAYAGTAISTSASVADPMDAAISALVASIAKLQKAINKINKRLAR